MSQPSTCEATLDDRSVSLLFLSFALGRTGEQALDESISLQSALEQTRAWRLQLDEWIETTARALSDVSAVESLLKGDKPPAD